MVWPYVAEDPIFTAFADFRIRDAILAKKSTVSDFAMLELYARDAEEKTSENAKNYSHRTRYKGMRSSEQQNARSNERNSEYVFVD